MTGFLVAIKRVSKVNLVKFNMVSRFTEEIYLHSKLEHPNIVKFYGFY
jgi:serine/threonine protein kinase